MPTINQDLRDLILKRSHYIYMFENGMIKDMVSPFNHAKVELMSKIANLEDYGQGWTLQYRMDRLNSQLREIDTVLKYANDEGIGVVSNYLNEFGQVEKDFYDNLLADKFGTIGIGINRLPIEQIHEIVNTPIGGLKYHERMIKHYDDSMFDIKSNLTQSIIQGEDMAKASRRLLGQGKEIGGIIGNRLMQQSQVIARTEIMRVSNSVAERIYNQNTDVLKGNQWLATLDSRTCLLPFSMIYTENGWKMIHELKIGEMVLTHNMEWKQIKEKMRQNKVGYLRIKLSNGRTLCITPDHKILVDGIWKEVGKLKKGDLIDGIDL